MKASMEKRLEELETYSGIDEESPMLILSDGRSVASPENLMMYILEHGYDYDGATIVDIEFPDNEDPDEYADPISIAMREGMIQMARGEYDPRVDVEMTEEMKEAGIYSIDTEDLKEWHQKKSKEEYLSAWQERKKKQIQ